MATISAFRTGLLLLATASVLVAAPASSQDLRAPHPVAYYDVETVVREAHALPNALLLELDIEKILELA